MSGLKLIPTQEKNNDRMEDANMNRIEDAGDKSRIDNKMDIDCNKTAGKRLEMSYEEMDLVCNPAYHAFKAGLEEFKKSNSVETLHDLHTILLIDHSQHHRQIQGLLPDLYQYFSVPEHYDVLCLIFSDISHLNDAVSESLVSYGIFGKLDYTKEISFSLVVSLCDSNPRNLDAFKDMDLERKIKEHPKLACLQGDD